MATLQMTINVEDASDNQWFSCRKLKGNWIVDWGDGTIEVNSEAHQYKDDGIYQITTKGDFTIGHLKCPYRIISLDKEEGCGITSLKNYFFNCPQLISVPKDWDVSKATSMKYMFVRSKSFNQDLSHWNLEKIYTVDMFYNCPIEEKHKPKGI